MSCNCHLNEFLVVVFWTNWEFRRCKQNSFIRMQFCGQELMGKTIKGSWEVITHDTLIQGIVWFFLLCKFGIGVRYSCFSSDNNALGECKASICLYKYYSKNLGKVTYIMIIFFGEPSPFFFKYWVSIVLFRRIWKNVTGTWEIINFIYRVNGKVFVRLDFCK